MFRKIGLSAALAFGFVAVPAAAEEHYVLMMDTGYFPDYVYPAVGDTIKFVNAGTLPMNATADDLSWTTGDLLPEQSVVIEVVDGMKQTFRSIVAVNGEIVTQSDTVGVIEYLNPVDLATNTLTGEVHEEAID